MSMLTSAPGVDHALSERMAQARSQTDQLFAIVKPEFLYDRPIAERHRIVFYIGHLEAFDWNLLRVRAFNLKAFHPEFDKLFAFGIDPVGGGLPADQPKDWPSLEEVRRYTARIRAEIDEALARVRFDGNSEEEVAPDVLLNVAIEHRLMHAETLTYMLHQLPYDRKIPHAHRPGPQATSASPEMAEIPAGRATLGLERDGDTFGWDNEYERHEVEVPAFAVDKHPITNGEYEQFISAGGYKDPAFWSPADWGWRAENSIQHPVFWQRSGNQWLYRTMFDEILLPLDWPVYVSHAEASAYARWAGKGLPTEAQWHRAAYGTPRGEERSYPWGQEAPRVGKGNFDFSRWDPTPVGTFSDNHSAFGVCDMLGNGWEWTSTPFQPLPGFKPFSFYPGYSADFFDGKHFVIKGGSARTAASMLRRSFRNWFQPHYQYVYAGFRCVTN